MKKSVVVFFLALTSLVWGAEKIKFVSIPEKNILMSSTEITQSQYESVMKENPSEFKGKNLPVESVNWYDAIYFCNALSEKEGLAPVYSVDGKTSVSEWNYTPHADKKITGDIQQNLEAGGYRLPTGEEQEAAANGKAAKNVVFAGSTTPDETCWYEPNSDGKTHEVAKKKANGYGLYDMCGNVAEWTWKINPNKPTHRWVYGGDFSSGEGSVAYFCYTRESGSSRKNNIGFRIVKKSK